MEESVEKEKPERLAVPELHIRQIAMEHSATHEEVKLLIDMDERITESLETTQDCKEKEGEKREERGSERSGIECHGKEIRHFDGRYPPQSGRFCHFSNLMTNLKK
ncbi:hypothetical protein AA0242T_1586 [Acetobacter aceti NRIC 0242]|uniref:Uncharacterized protein n=1 Tax=Acetobacter aceti NBRC 14818 TaxID=887700 RepID=A0AB33I8V4_ACEAC|nr:hypothetical protein EMQ_0454 [Acetobacter aceti NBRC 14818]GAN57191.1 hypothetical protein Abac_014_117 [Acetobacter aceti NBRC 14818]GBO80884.1 hypothetical protein AA0242T_1586 [Acetobacter aceti NRIC 0242]